VAAAMAKKEALWLSKLLKALGVDGGAVQMREDNRSFFALVNIPEATKRTMHGDVVYQMVREYQAHGDVASYFLLSAEMPADGLTKPLPSPALMASGMPSGLLKTWARLCGAPSLATPRWGSAAAP